MASKAMGGQKGRRKVSRSKSTESKRSAKSGRNRKRA
jgi:hypothetical protein